jgi:hypothetical protein
VSKLSLTRKFGFANDVVVLSPPTTAIVDVEFGHGASFILLDFTTAVSFEPPLFHDAQPIESQESDFRERLPLRKF